MTGYGSRGGVPRGHPPHGRDCLAHAQAAVRGGSGLTGPWFKAYKSASAWEPRPLVGRVDGTVPVHLPAATVAATTPRTHCWCA